mmetsp:Transcript_35996/g.75788  ORF Transcript_35996/g.75788 Transcript_35996/m.75788 type:complete len:303 (-) Transcript_35996:431-1339(-)
MKFRDCIMLLVCVYSVISFAIMYAMMKEFDRTLANHIESDQKTFDSGMPISSHIQRHEISRQGAKAGLTPSTTKGELGKTRKKSMQRDKVDLPYAKAGQGRSALKGEVSKRSSIRDNLNQKRREHERDIKPAIKLSKNNQIPKNNEKKVPLGDGHFIPIRYKDVPASEFLDTSFFPRLHDANASRYAAMYAKKINRTVIGFHGSGEPLTHTLMPPRHGEGPFYAIWSSGGEKVTASAWRIVRDIDTQYLDVFTYQRPPKDATSASSKNEIVDVQGDQAAFHGWFPNFYGRESRWCFCDVLSC